MWATGLKYNRKSGFKVLRPMWGAGLACQIFKFFLDAVCSRRGHGQRPSFNPRPAPGRGAEGVSIREACREMVGRGGIIKACCSPKTQTPRATRVSGTSAHCLEARVQRQRRHGDADTLVPSPS